MSDMARFEKSILDPSNAPEGTLEQELLLALRAMQEAGLAVAVPDRDVFRAIVPFELKFDPSTPAPTRSVDELFVKFKVA